MRTKSKIRIQMLIMHTPTICGIALILILCSIYLSQGLAVVRRSSEAARAVGKVLVVGEGDVAARDIPKALTIQQGDFFGDPHYEGEVHWYPFMTPLLSASIASLFGWQIDFAYFVIGIVCSAILLPAIGYLLYTYAGVPGLFALLIGLLLKFFWPDNGIYPFQTARVAFVIYLVIAGLLARQLPVLNRRTQTLFLMLGILNGLLGLWHGASFFAATTISGILVIFLGYYCLRNHYTLRALILTVVLFCAGFLALFGLLIVPQLLHYGRLVQNEAARLWLTGYYQDGNVPSLFFSLSLRPRGLDSLFFAGFLLAMWSSKSKEMLPLLIGYIFSKGLAHLGFVLHSTDYPQLAIVSAKLLQSPPHTFNGLGDFLLILIKFSVVGFMLQQVAHFAYLMALKARLNQTVGAAVLASVGYVILAYQLLSHLPAQAPLHARQVNQAVVDVAQTVSETIGQSALFSKDGRYDKLSLFQFAPVKVLYANLPEHANPYIEYQRRLAQANILEHPESAFDNGIEYVLSKAPTDTAATIAKLCGAALVFEARNGYKLWQLERPCTIPPMQSDIILSKPVNVNVVMQSAEPLVVAGTKIAPGQDNYLEWQQMPILVGKELIKLEVSGHTVDGTQSCLRPRFIFWGPNGYIGERAVIYHVQGEFDIAFYATYSDDTILISPEITFPTQCQQGHPLQLDKVKFAYVQ